MKRYLYIALGLIALTLGLLGIITPGLPTTPFILLTGFLFAKSSPRLHQMLMNNRLTGRYINKVNEGFSLKGVIISVTIMWCMVCFTAFVVFNYGTMRFVMLGLGLVGTIAQVIVLKKKKDKNKNIKTIQTVNLENMDQQNKLEAS